VSARVTFRSSHCQQKSSIELLAVCQGGPWLTLHPQHWGGTTRTGDFKCREVKTGFCRKRWMQTGSSGSLIGWKSSQTTYFPLWDRMVGSWLWTPHTSAISEWGQCEWWARGPPCSLLEGGPWLTQQQAAGWALAHPATATLHTSTGTISEWGQCEWWARARPAAC
jgi:hypothetical protein